MLYNLAIFHAYERTVPYSTIARVSLSNGMTTREDVNELRDYSIQATWKIETLCLEFKKEQLKVKELEGQIRALKVKTDMKPDMKPDMNPDMLVPKKEKERKLDTLAAVKQRNAVLQKTLGDLLVVHEATVSRLEKAEARIRETENAKVEKLDSDLKNVPTKPSSPQGWIHDTVVAPDGFSYMRRRQI
jgi:hypothetical protein